MFHLVPRQGFCVSLLLVWYSPCRSQSLSPVSHTTPADQLPSLPICRRGLRGRCLSGERGVLLKAQMSSRQLSAASRAIAQGPTEAKESTERWQLWQNGQHIFWYLNWYLFITLARATLDCKMKQTNTCMTDYDCMSTYKKNICRFPSIKTSLFAMCLTPMFEVQRSLAWASNNFLRFSKQTSLSLKGLAMISHSWDSGEHLAMQVVTKYNNI